MGVLWAGGIVIYGRGASMEGALGPVFGFPIMLIISILTANAAGAVSGEWRGTQSAARTTMVFGVGIMFVAILSFSATLITRCAKAESTQLARGTLNRYL